MLCKSKGSRTIPSGHTLDEGAAASSQRLRMARRAEILSLGNCKHLGSAGADQGRERAERSEGSLEARRRFRKLASRATVNHDRQNLSN